MPREQASGGKAWHIRSGESARRHRAAGCYGGDEQPGNGKQIGGLGTRAFLPIRPIQNLHNGIMIVATGHQCVAELLYQPGTNQSRPLTLAIPINQKSEIVRKLIRRIQPVPHLDVFAGVLAHHLPGSFAADRQQLRFSSFTHSPDLSRQHGNVKQA